MFALKHTLAVLALVASTAGASNALPYELDENVVVVHDRNFDTIVENHRTVLVEFYAPWCGHCKNLAPEYSAVAKFVHKAQDNADERTMVVAKCDATANRNLAMKNMVTSYPTILLFQHSDLVEKYTGERSFEDITEYVKDMDASCASDGNAPKSNSKQSASQPSKSAAAPTKKFRYAPPALVDAGFVHIVSPDSGNVITDSDTPWLIAVFKNGCGHCRRMEGQWVAALQELYRSDKASKVKIAVVDAEGMDRESELLQILPGYRGTPGFFSYIPASISPSKKGIAANVVTASRTGDMVSAVVDRISTSFAAEVASIADMEAIAKAQSISIAHDVTFVLITSPDNDQAGDQVQEFKALAAEKATAMFLHTSNSAEFAQHFGVSVSATQSAVVALDSRGKPLPGFVYLLNENDKDTTWLVRDLPHA